MEYGEGRGVQGIYGGLWAIPMLGHWPQGLSYGEIVVVVMVLLVMLHWLWQQGCRIMGRLTNGLITKVKWTIVILGALMLIHARIRNLGGFWIAPGLPFIGIPEWFQPRAVLGLAMANFILWGIIGLLLRAKNLSGGGRPGQHARGGIANNIYMTSPDAINTTVADLLKRTDLDEKFNILENLIKETIITQGAITHQLAVFSKFLEGLQITLPSANFLSYSLDEVSDRMEERLKGVVGLIDNVINVVEKGNTSSARGDWNKETDIKKTQTPDAEYQKNSDKPMVFKTPEEESEIRQPNNNNKLEFYNRQQHTQNQESEAENDPEPELEVNAINAGFLKTKKSQGKALGTSKQKTKPQTNTPVSAGLTSMFATMSEEEVLEQLLKRRKERKEEARKPIYLTEEEKKMSLATLDKIWKEEEQRERSLWQRKSDNDLGLLTEEEKKLSKAELKFLIRQRKQEAWVKSMKEKNIPLFRCDVCSQITTTNHRCSATSWAMPGTHKLVPITQEVIFQQTGGGDIRLKKIQRPDEGKVNKQYEALAEHLQTKILEDTRISNMLESKKPEIGDGMEVMGDTAPEPLAVNTTQLPLYPNSQLCFPNFLQSPC